jgi:hypothetical protein
MGNLEIKSGCGGAPLLHGLADDGLPIRRRSLAGVAEVDFVVPAAQLTAGIDELV